MKAASHSRVKGWLRLPFLGILIFAGQGPQAHAAAEPPPEDSTTQESLQEIINILYADQNESRATQEQVFTPLIEAINKKPALLYSAFLWGEKRKKGLLVILFKSHWPGFEREHEHEQTLNTIWSELTKVEDGSEDGSEDDSAKELPTRVKSLARSALHCTNLPAFRWLHTRAINARYALPIYQGSWTRIILGKSSHLVKKGHEALCDYLAKHFPYAFEGQGPLEQGLWQKKNYQKALFEAMRAQGDQEILSARFTCFTRFYALDPFPITLPRLDQAAEAGHEAFFLYCLPYYKEHTQTDEQEIQALLHSLLHAQRAHNHATLAEQQARLSNPDTDLFKAIQRLAWQEPEEKIAALEQGAQASDQLLHLFLAQGAGQELSLETKLGALSTRLRTAPRSLFYLFEPPASWPSKERSPTLLNFLLQGIGGLEQEQVHQALQGLQEDVPAQAFAPRYPRERERYQEAIKIALATENQTGLRWLLELPEGDTSLFELFSPYKANDPMWPIFKGAWTKEVQKKLSSFLREREGKKIMPHTFWQELNNKLDGEPSLAGALVQVGDHQAPLWHHLLKSCFRRTAVHYPCLLEAMRQQLGQAPLEEQQRFFFEGLRSQPQEQASWASLFESQPTFWATKQPGEGTTCSFLGAILRQDLTPDAQGYWLRAAFLDLKHPLVLEKDLLLVARLPSKNFWEKSLCAYLQRKEKVSCAALVDQDGSTLVGLRNKHAATRSEAQAQIKYLVEKCDCRPLAPGAPNAPEKPSPKPSSPEPKEPSEQKGSWLWIPGSLLLLGGSWSYLSMEPEQALTPEEEEEAPQPPPDSQQETTTSPSPFWLDQAPSPVPEASPSKPPTQEHNKAQETEQEPGTAP